MESSTASGSWSFPQRVATFPENSGSTPCASRTIARIKSSGFCHGLIPSAAPTRLAVNLPARASYHSLVCCFMPSPCVRPTRGRCIVVRTGYRLFHHPLSALALPVAAPSALLVAVLVAALVPVASRLQTALPLTPSYRYAPGRRRQ